MSGAGVLGGTSYDYGLVSGVNIGAYSSVGGFLYVELGGVASNVTQDDGSSYVYSGGVERGTIVDNGYLEITLGGAASGAILNSGGYDYIYGKPRRARPSTAALMSRSIPAASPRSRPSTAAESSMSIPEGSPAARPSTAAERKSSRPAPLWLARLSSREASSRAPARLPVRSRFRPALPLSAMASSPARPTSFGSAGSNWELQ